MKVIQQESLLTSEDFKVYRRVLIDMEGYWARISMDMKGYHRIFKDIEDFQRIFKDIGQESV